MFKKNLSLIVTYIFLIFCSSIFNVSANGEIPYENVIVDLTPSGRQIDIGIDYVVELDNDLILGFKNTISKDFNHINDAQLNNTFTFTETLDF